MTPKTTNTMGKISKLSQFSGIQAQPEVNPSTPTQVTAVSPAVTSPETSPEKLATINIKIASDQHTWLTQTARQVRDNNQTPVAPSDRVFPQHLIGVAIALLQASEVDWNQVQTTDDLKQFLNI